MSKQNEPGETAAAEKVGRRFPLVVLGLGLLGVVGYRFMASPHGISDVAHTAEQAASNEPTFTRVGDRIIVPPGSPLRSHLVVAGVESNETPRTLVLPAIVEANPARTVKVLPPVGGRVVALKVQLGERVTEGQELAVIDSGDLAQALSDDEKARTQLTLTKQALERQKGLEKGGGGAIKDREQAESDYAQAKSEFERAETRLRAIGMATNQKEGVRLLSVTAPAAGSIIDLAIAPGAYINDATATMMTIANLDTIWVTANVPEKDTAFVSTGQPVDVTFPAYPTERFSGKALFVSDVLEPDSRRTKVRIAFDNPDKMLKPNMFANASFIGPSVMRVSVPTSALVMSNDSTTAFVEVEPWTFERRAVEIDFQDGDSAVIRKGVNAGERVVTKGAVRIND